MAPLRFAVLALCILVAKSHDAQISENYAFNKAGSSSFSSSFASSGSYSSGSNSVSDSPPVISNYHSSQNSGYGSPAGISITHSGVKPVSAASFPSVGGTFSSSFSTVDGKIPENLPSNVPFWWLSNDSPFKHVYQSFVSTTHDHQNQLNQFISGQKVPHNGCNDNGCSFTGSFNVHDSKEHKNGGAIDISKNPFLNGEIHSGHFSSSGSASGASSGSVSGSHTSFGVGSGSNKLIDVSSNPFLNNVKPGSSISGSSSQGSLFGSSSGSHSVGGGSKPIDVSNNPFLNKPGGSGSYTGSGSFQTGAQIGGSQSGSYSGSIQTGTYPGSSGSLSVGSYPGSSQVGTHPGSSISGSLHNGGSQSGSTSQSGSYQSGGHVGGSSGGSQQVGTHPGSSISGSLHNAGSQSGSTSQSGSYQSGGHVGGSSGGSQQVGTYPGSSHQQQGTFPGSSQQQGSFPGSSQQSGSFSGSSHQSGSVSGSSHFSGSTSGSAHQSGSYSGSSQQTGSFPGSSQQTGTYPDSSSGAYQPGTKTPGFQIKCSSAQRKLCVDKHLCLNGVVNTNGEGLFQVRSQDQYCEADSQVCCSLPDNYQTGPSPTAAQKCDGKTSTCVQKHLCLNGKVNIHGEGVFQVRSQEQICAPSEICCRLVDDGSKKEKPQPDPAALITTGHNILIPSGPYANVKPGSIVSEGKLYEYGSSEYHKKFEGSSSNSIPIAESTSPQSTFLLGGSPDFGPSVTVLGQPGGVFHTGNKPGDSGYNLNGATILGHGGSQSGSSSGSGLFSQSGNFPSQTQHIGFGTGVSQQGYEYKKPDTGYLPATTKKPFKADGYIPPPQAEIDPSGSDISGTQILPPTPETNIIPGPTNTRPTFIRPFTESSLIVNTPYAGCAAALKCVDISFCTFEGVISKTVVTLSKTQNDYRVPLTDCSDVGSGKIGKCCRDPDYVDPWPASQLGQYNPELLGFDTGAYKGERYTSKYRPSVPKTPTLNPSGSITQFTKIPRPENNPTYPISVTQRPQVQPTFPTISLPSKPPVYKPVPVFPEPSRPQVLPPIPQQPQPFPTAHPFPPKTVNPTITYTGSSNTPIPTQYNPVVPPFATSPPKTSYEYQPAGSVKTERCGVRNLNGSPKGPGPIDAAFGEFPWQAMVLLQTNRSLLCGGAIIENDAVVTAAHCVDGLNPTDILIKGGEWKLGVDEEPKTFQIVQVKSISFHPAYQPTDLEYDVAILHLTEKLKFDTHIDTLCLPEVEQNFQETTHQDCVTTGWGKETLQVNLQGSILHKLDVTLLPPYECQARTSTYGARYNDKSSYCGKVKDVSESVCETDVGSALACRRGDGHYQLQGLYSWESGCQPSNQVVSFVKMDVPWIKTALKNPQPPRIPQIAYTPQPSPQTSVNTYVNPGNPFHGSIKGGPAYLPPV